MQEIVTIWEDIDEILEIGHYRKILFDAHVKVIINRVNVDDGNCLMRI